MSKARDLADSAQEINILDGKSFLDEDNLASDSATGIASQQSIKAYVDGITTTNITSTGALNSGSITSGFGNIDNGSSTITTTGAITGGSFVIGSADINENDLESIDGITAGTVAASKAVVVNANKDITGFRNLTATGTISGSLSGTLSGSLSSTTTATTQAESDDSTKVATTAYVTDKITTLIGGAPSTLNDLNELAAAINDDANYNSTLTTALATKLPLAGGTMTGDVLYNDSVKAKFGAGSDLQIYHDGSNSFIKDAGTGNLRINADDFTLTNAANNSNLISTFNGEVYLYNNSNVKLLTTSTGIQVTGNIANASGDLTLDVAGSIYLDSDAGDIFFTDNGTNTIRFNNTNGTLNLKTNTSDADIQFQGNDGGVGITALTLDMSDAGTAIFNHDIKLGDVSQLQMGASSDFQIFHNGTNNYIKNATSDQDLIIQGNDGGSIINALTLDMSDAGTATFNSHLQMGDNKALRLGSSNNDLKLYHDGTNSHIDNDTGDLNIDVAGDIILDAASNDVIFSKNGTERGRILLDAADFKIQSTASNADIIFRGNDGGVGITALTLDMSDGGTAIFNSYAKFPDNQRVVMGSGNDFSIYHSSSDNNSYIEETGTGSLVIAADQLYIQNAAKTETKAQFDTNGAVELRYDDSKKFETTSSGITVTGTVAATSYTGDGSNLTGVGGSTTAGDVGTYTTGRPANYTTYTTGSTVSGSSLVVASGSAWYYSGGWQGVTSGGSNAAYSVGTTRSGTWRLMSYAGGASSFGVTGLWVRIS